MMAKRYWLMKCEPESYSIDDLERDGTTTWEGVRNYQARNFLRDDMKVGDRVLFYASGGEPPGVTGVAEICKAGYPDHFAWKKGHHYFDPKSDPAKPTWYMVDLKFVEKFREIVSISEIKAMAGLEKMMVVQRGSRLSVQPATKEEFDTVVQMGRRKRS